MATSTRTRMTPLAQLIDAELRAQRGIDLPTYLAIARAPGHFWQTYDQIVADLGEVAARPLNRVSIKTFAEGQFGIPDTRYVRVGNRDVSMPKDVGADVTDRYEQALNPQVIDIARVHTMIRASLSEAASRAEREAEDARHGDAFADGNDQ